MPALLALRVDPAVVALSCLTAVFASYVALGLVQRVRTPDRAVAGVWWWAGSLSMGTGIWALYFVGMLALQLPIEVGHDGLVTLLSWLAAVAVSAIALRTAAHDGATVKRQALGALGMGVGIGAMHYTGMAALVLAPGMRWTLPLVAASAAVATAAAAAALLLSALATSALDARRQGRNGRLQQSLHAATTEPSERALRDPLTGLANRQLLDDRISHALARGRRDGASLALLMLNLDAFKPVNDSFGHAAGDAVLLEVATRLQAQARGHDTLARLGADEFVVLIEGDTGEAVLAQIAQRLLDSLAVPMSVNLGADGQASQVSQVLRLSASIGIVLHSGPDVPGRALIAQADSAAQAVKRGGGNGFAFFEAHMQDGVRDQLELARDLRAALEDGGAGLSLHYQPKVAGDTKRVLGVEALLRWQHPRRGAIGPIHFIPVAERFGIIVALGGWVIDEACRQIAEWRDQGLQLRVAINLSVQQLRQPEALLQRLQQALQRHHLDASQLSCEITESVAMEDTGATERVLQRLGALGVALSIDDFGTGYSSLAYLRRLPVSQLKIDRSFIQDLETSADARAIVRAVIELAHALGLEVVAEGVETEGQAAVLRAKRCDKLQGYFFARPMPAQALVEWAMRPHDPEGRLDFSDSVMAAEMA